MVYTANGLRGLKVGDDSLHAYGPLDRAPLTTCSALATIVHGRYDPLCTESCSGQLSLLLSAGTELTVLGLYDESHGDILLSNIFDRTPKKILIEAQASSSTAVVVSSVADMCR